MTPTIFFTCPEKFLTIIQPIPATITIIRIPQRKYIDPCFIFLIINRFCIACFHITEHQVAFILLSVQVLNDEFIAVSGPFHSGNIGSPFFIIRYFHPCCFASGYINRTYFIFRWRFASNGVLYRYSNGINGVGIIDH